MIGGHWIKGYSPTQQAVTLSSAEAELVATVKMTSEILGVLSMMRDLGKEARGTVWADSAAALGIIKRKGAGRMRHINVGMLWIQQKEEDKEIIFKKIKGESNPADLMTKHPSKKSLEAHMKTMRMRRSNDRASASLRTQGAT